MSVNAPATSFGFALPERPKLRSLEPRWVQVEGETRLWLRDPLGLSDRNVLLPELLVPLLLLLDGEHDLTEIAAAFGAQLGGDLPVSTVHSVLTQLDEALTLDSGRYRAAAAAAAGAYRALPHRLPSLASRSYPAPPRALARELERYRCMWGETLPEGGPPRAEMRPIASAAGLLSPHIDFARGGPLYAGAWELSLPAVGSAEIVVIFGTDHHGSAGRLTPTVQRYATPWGPLPAEDETIGAVARAFGEVEAFEEELHHRDEHSIELAAVWLHWALRQGRGAQLPPVIPLLCGSFHCYTHAAPGDACRDGALPEDDEQAAAALDALVAAIGGRRTLVVAAADLAHVGPAFGDPAPLSAGDKHDLEVRDAELLETVRRGDAGLLLGTLRRERDRRRVCGLPPIYWSMRLLERLAGHALPGRVVGYQQCPADDQNGSVVSIAGALWEDSGGQ